MSLDVAGICSATAKTLKEPAEGPAASLFESACPQPLALCRTPVLHTPPFEHPPTSDFQLPLAVSAPFPPTVPERPWAVKTCMGAGFQNQLVHRIPFDIPGL